MLQHHRAGPDRSYRIGDALACDIGSRTVHGFEHGWVLFLRIEIGRRRDSDRAGAGGAEVRQYVAEQIAAGNKHIIGGMVESHLVSGRQDVKQGQELLFGQSITDACINWSDSIPLLQGLAEAVRERRIQNK